jgi:proteasome lid subunit RPN8/RPN11
VTLAPGALAVMLAHAREAAPAECCGLLLGKDDAIAEAVRAANVSGNPNRYEINPKDYIVTRREARERRLDVLGFYHSHPHSSAEPSPTDLAEATYPELLYVIVSLAAELAEVRMFRLDAGAATEVDYRLTT